MEARESSQDIARAFGKFRGSIYSVLSSSGGIPPSPVAARLYEALRAAGVDALLDVGCGSGVLDRWLARRSRGANPITAVELNCYLLREAQTLARKAVLESTLDLRPGDAEALPFEDASFDAALSFTVMEECDAERMLAEMVRVTRPEGRVAVVVRGDDLPAGYPIRMHDVIACPTDGPEVAHQIINAGTVTMRYLAISTLSEFDACEYPDAGKVSVVTGQRGEGGLRKMFRAESTVDYYDREPR